MQNFLALKEKKYLYLHSQKKRRSYLADVM